MLLMYCNCMSMMLLLVHKHKQRIRNTMTKDETATIGTIKIEEQPYYIYYLNIDGIATPVQRKVSESHLSHYADKGVKIYEWQSKTVKKDAQGKALLDTQGNELTEMISNYSIALDDYKAHKPLVTRANTTDKIEAMMAQGLSHAEIIAKLLGQ